MAGSTRKFGVAILGLGRMGTIHSQNLNHSGRAIIKWFVRNDLQKAQQFAQKFMVPPQCAIPEEMEKVLSDTSVDGVVVCSSTSVHEAQVKAALNAGKRVLCEKPITNSLETTIDCYNLAESVGQPLLCAFHRRFDESICALRKTVQSSRLRLLRVSSHDFDEPPISYLKHSGGILFDSTIHDLDLALWITDSPVKTVYAHGRCFRKDVEDIGDHDLVVVTLEHQNGTVTTIDNGRKCAHGYDQRVEAVCDEGNYTITNQPTDLLYRYTSQHSLMPRIDASFDTRYVGAYANLLTHFLDIMDGASLQVTKEDIISVMTLIKAANQSLQSGKAVHLT